MQCAKKTPQNNKNCLSEWTEGDQSRAAFIVAELIRASDVMSCAISPLFTLRDQK